MTNAHTPGPWGIDRDIRRGMEWNNHIVDQRRGYAICFMAHSDGQAPERDKANAHLIAAAPELLDAINSLCDRIDDEGCTPLDWAEFTAARAAIAKATGVQS